MEQLTLEPISKVSGEVNVPGSKSLSNRALLLAALAEGETELTNLLDSEDIEHMLNALTKLGVTYSLSEDKTRCKVVGNGGAFSVAEPLELFLGNAGTAMRPLCAALAARALGLGAGGAGVERGRRGKLTRDPVLAAVVRACRLMHCWPSQAHGIPFEDVVLVLTSARLEDEAAADAIRRRR